MENTLRDEQAIEDKRKDKIKEISKNMTYMELSVHPKYMDEFIAACFIPHTNLNLFPSLKKK